MKKLLLSITLLICTPLAILNAGLANIPQGEPSLQLPPLSDDQWQAFSELLNNMSEEELEFYAKLGEEYINEELKEGRDPYAIFNQLAEPSLPEEKPLPLPEQPKEEEKPALSDAKKEEEASVFLKNISRIISIIRQKAESDRTSRELLAPWRYHCDDLIYYAHKLNEHKFLKHFADKEFDPLFKALKQLNDQLLLIEPLIQFPTMDVEGESPYQLLGVSPRASMEEIQQAYQTLLQQKKPEAIKKQFSQEGKQEGALEDALEQASIERDTLNKAYTEIRAYEQARQALNNFIETLNSAIYTNTILENTKKLLQKYEPEALKIKQEQEKKEVVSRKEQEDALKKRPSFVPPIFQRPDSGASYHPPAPYTPSRGGYTPSYSPPAPEQPAGMTPSTPPAAPGSKKKDEKPKDDKKKEKETDKKEGETKKKDEKPKENKKIPEKLVTVEVRFKDLANYIQNEDPITGIKPMDLFKQFSTYLQTPIAKPYQADDPQIIKASQINTALVQITNHIHTIKKEMRNLKDFSTAEKRALKKSFNDLFEKYKKDSLEKNLKDFFSLTLTPENAIMEADGSIKNIPAEKKYIHLGVNEFVDIDDPENDLIKNQNPGKINFIAGLSNALKEIQKEFKEAPKPPLAPGLMPPAITTGELPAPTAPIAE